MHQYQGYESQQNSNIPAQDRSYETQNQDYEHSYQYDELPLNQSFISTGEPLAGRQLWHLPQENGMASGKEQIAAGLCYLCFWLTGLLFLLFEPKSRLIRFHAIQSLFFFGTVTILYFVLINAMINTTSWIFGIAVFVFIIMNIIAAVAWMVGIAGAISGRYTRLPFVGQIVTRYMHQGAALK